MNKKEGNKLLKQCPFCGNKAYIFTAPNKLYGISCSTPGCVMMPAIYKRNIEDLIMNWNNRESEFYEEDKESEIF